MTHSQECSLLRVDPVHTFCHHTLSTKSTINDTTFSSRIIKETRQKAKENTHPVFCVSYTVLFLTFNILRLSAVSQMGYKPMFWRPALLPSSGSRWYKTPSHRYIYIYPHTHTHTQIYIYSLKISLFVTFNVFYPEVFDIYI